MCLQALCDAMQLIADTSPENDVLLKQFVNPAPRLHGICIIHARFPYRQHRLLTVP